LITLPSSHEEALKAEIKKTFGLIAHTEMREMDVLLLKEKMPSASELTSHPSGKSMGVTDKDGKVYITGQTLDVFSAYVEYALNKPVLNRTSLNGRYDFVLDKHLFDGTSDPDLVKKTLMDEFGLEPVPSRESIEVLVVEKLP
jgi:uncharacterized protein (TIGR03435 family)